MNELTHCSSVQRILECIKGIATAILDDINQYYRRTQPKSPAQIDLGCDDMVSILTYVLIKANVPDLPAKLAFVNEFADRDLLAEESKFRVIQLEQAMKYNQGLQWEVKDENGVVVPLQVVERKLLETMRTENMAFQSEHKQSPVTHWLSELLLLCGTVPFEILVVGEKLARPPLRVPYKGPNIRCLSLLKEPTYFQLAQRILTAVGITLHQHDDDFFLMTFLTTFSAHVYIHLSKQVDLQSAM